MSHPRSGGHELSNFSSTGLDLSASVKASASAEASSQQKKGEGAIDQKYGQGSSSTAKKTGTLVYDMLTETPIAERYSGNYWSSSSLLAGDEGFQQLRKMLDEQAAVSESVRRDRENALREKSASAASIMATYVPYGTIAAAALYAFTEGAIALGNLLSKNTKDSQENRDRADRAVRALWGEWMIKPPSFEPDIMSAEMYANQVEGILRVLRKSEDEGNPWRARWLAAMTAGIESSIPAARDVSRLGWVPLDMLAWEGIGYTITPEGMAGMWKAPYQDKGFGTVTTVEYKPGFLSAARATKDVYTVPTYDEMARRCDPYAAGVGVMVAVQKGVAVEPVVEAAVQASREWLQASGPNVDLAGFRLKGVFEAAERAAATAPKNPMLVARRTVDSRLDRIQTVKDAGKGLILSKGSVKLAAEALLSPEDRGFRHMKQWWSLRKLPRKVGGK